MPGPFIGGAQDERLHAFDCATGELLWEGQLEAGGYATPSTYMVNGRQREDRLPQRRPVRTLRVTFKSLSS